MLLILRLSISWFELKLKIHLLTYKILNRNEPRLSTAKGADKAGVDYWRPEQLD